MQNYKIFSFWEPKDKVPPYIQLCMETWNKFLPDYEIVLLDYETLPKYLDIKELQLDKLKYFSLPKQSDVIRMHLLNKYGGIWFDADSIIMSENFKNLVGKSLSSSDFVAIETPTKYHPYTGIIFANKNNYVCTEYIKEAQKRVSKFGKNKNKLIITKIFNNKLYKAYKNWDFLGNGIIDSIINNKPQEIYLPLQNSELNAFPETIYFNTLDRRKAYEEFYFNNTISFNFENCAIIQLHNSWTPEKYLFMNKDDFLNCNNTLSKLLKELLK